MPTKRKVKIRWGRVIRWLVLLLFLVVLLFVIIHTFARPAQSSTKKVNSAVKPVNTPLTLSFIGDNTLGNDDNYDGRYHTLPEVFQENGSNYAYFYKNVASIFKQDDLTIGNNEGTFTTSNNPVAKVNLDDPTRIYHFKGDPKFAQSYKLAGIDVLTLANNHSNDYGPQGFADTKAALAHYQLASFGYDAIYTTTLKGIKIGFFGYESYGSSEAMKPTVLAAINKLKAEGCSVIIPFMHWGIEYQYQPDGDQVDLAHYMIDNGATLVIGSHPHVFETVENYKGHLIAYSMGNFAFGGDPNPEDTRTMILQVQISTAKQVAVKIIPTSVTSKSAPGNSNDFQPTPMDKTAAGSFLSALNQVSPSFNNQLSENWLTLK